MDDVFGKRQKEEALPPVTFANIIAMLDSASKATQCCITAIAIDSAIVSLKQLAKQYGQPVVEQMMLIEDAAKPSLPRAQTNQGKPTTKQAPRSDDWGDDPPF